MKHYTFPKIKQYHQVLRDIKLQISYIGKDENDEAIYKEPDTWPIIKFTGRIKLHGTNAAIVFSPDGSFYCQSRENIINEIQDNAGFAHWVNKEGKHVFSSLGVDFNGAKHIILFGEWCGGSIQKGVALNQLEKRFVVFGMKAIFEDETTQWLDFSGIRNHSINVYNIDDYRKYEIDIDLNRPDKAIEQMTQWTTEIGNECPFAKEFGVSGVGEGLVWRIDGVHGYSTSFKTKDEKHTISKIKKLPTVDVQKLDSIQEAVDTHCHEDRLQQIYDKVVVTEADKIPQKIGDFVRLVIEDCWEEEGDSIRSSDITRKEFGAVCSKKIAKWFQIKISQL
jgi:hypothetical protein